jgi:MFS family permease
MANPDSYFEPLTPPTNSALDRARIKAYWRLLPLLFLSYLIAYVDRSNVSILKLKMIGDLPDFNNDIFGFGMGIFFAGYCLLEIPGTLIVERWSARKWICRIMITWGIFAALTSLVAKPWHFYSIRFLLGLAEAGFYPGVIVYLTHWFPKRDRSRALAYFFMAGPLAQLISPKLTNLLLRIGTDETVNGVLIHHPRIAGLAGWQWAYILWGIPAVVLGVLVLFFLTDRPAQARWLKDDEREALENELAREKAEHPASKHMTLWEALSNRKVLTLTAAYFFVVTGNYGVEFFMPTPAADRIIDRPVPRRLELRQDRRAPPAHGRAHLHGRLRPVRPGAHQGPSDLAHGHPAHDRDGWPEGVLTRLLVVTYSLLEPDRRRRKHRPDQLGRESRRLGGTDHDGKDRVSHRLVPGRADVPGRLDDHLGHDHLDARARQASRQAGQSD